MPLGGGVPLPSRAGGLMIGGVGGGLMHHGGFGSTGGTEMLVEVQETPPAGCSPDAIKLFVGNLPKSCTEEQLMPFFETIGKVRGGDRHLATSFYHKQPSSPLRLWN